MIARRNHAGIGSIFLASVALVFLGIGVWTIAADQKTDDIRTDAAQKLKENNFNDAYQGFKQLAMSASTPADKVGSDLQNAIDCLARLGRVDEIDAVREAAVAAQSKNWRLLQAAATSLINGPQFGSIVAGEFRRGNRPGGGIQYVMSLDRDRVRALQLFSLALPEATQEGNAAVQANFFLEFAAAVMHGRDQNAAWRLQHLTDLTTLPDFQDRQGGMVRSGQGLGSRTGFGGGTRGAPVDVDGQPVFYFVPDVWNSAKSDGERWRWLLAQPERFIASKRPEMQLMFANFLRGQFGVQTMRATGFGVLTDSEEVRRNESGPYAVGTLKETETIAQLATGIKRFDLPDEFNFIRIYQNVASGEKSSANEEALDTLTRAFEDRRQYSRAAECLRKAIEKYGPGDPEYLRHSIQQFVPVSEETRKIHLEQIVGNWGRFENVRIQPVGRGATVDFRYRNGTKVKFEAHIVKAQALLDDVKKYLKSAPNQIDGNKTNIGNIGHRLVEQNQKQYVGDRVAQWELDLAPLPDHLDRTITVAAPLQSAGAYLLTGQMVDGNVSRIIVWITDTAIVQKQMENQTLYFVADAATGTPLVKTNVEFFGWKQELLPQGKQQIAFANFAEFTDDNGLVIPSEKQMPPQYQWVAMVRSDEGRFAYLGFTNVWYNHNYDQEYSLNRTYGITDRPVYRPGQPVNFKFWIRTARYDQDGNTFANQDFKVRIVDPRGKSIEDRKLTTDEYGGFDGTYTLPEGALLGRWGIFVIDHPGVNGSINFRVEEYKKPEFEVSIDRPTESVMLGEKISATVKAKYYFGAPVTTATVKVKVERTVHNSRWYPIHRWDWLFGNGYWWFASDYAWYPGWSDWGCKRPFPVWSQYRQDPPELVLENEVAIGPDGTVKVEFDTLPAKELHGDQDHSYSITAEVVDDSRRTIVGTGNVLVGRKPFNVFTWIHRGYYHVGDTIEASFKAQTLDQNPVAGKGKVTLYKITYDDGKPIEKPIQDWDLVTGDRGEAQLKIDATTAGQYRLSCTVTDGKGHSREGAYIFVITGPGFDGKGFRFNDLEIVADKSEYKPGETVSLMVNTNRPDGSILLFLRPTNGVYLPPRLLKLSGQSTTVDIAVVQKDMPNFFVEAVTIFDGKVHTEAREIVVPPEPRMLNVQITPSAETYRPGSKAEMQIKLTDYAGKPFVGSTVVSIYDKSVEYISGGSNVIDIKKFFWSWRRRYFPNSSNNLMMTFYNLLKTGERGMVSLGVFGGMTEQGYGAGYGVRGRAAANGAAPSAKFMQPQARVLSAAKAGDGAPVAPLATDADEKPDGAAGSDLGELIDPGVRKKFANTAIWVGSLLTDKNGLATVSLEMPENLGAWKARTWALGTGTQVGESSVEVTTTKNVLLRMQAPRFFVETDQVVLSANVHNYLKTEKSVKVVLELVTEALVATTPLSSDVAIAANGETRIDWRVRVAKSGTAVIRMKALTNEESDAMEMSFPVYVHGMLKTDSYTGIAKHDEPSQSVTVTVPEKRRANESRLEVRYSPTLAGAIVDALPYLIDYPIKTTDTTLCKFLPTVITQNILKRMNVDLAAIKEHQTNLNPQEIGDVDDRARQWKRFDHNPVFDNAEVQSIVKAAVQDLTAMQLADGGWGWLSGWQERSDPHMTAQIVHGLQLARENDIAIVRGVLDKGIEWLKRYQQSQIALLKAGDARDEKSPESLRLPHKASADNLDALVFLVLVDADQLDEAMRDYLYRDRGKVSVYALGLIGLAMHKIQDQPKLQMVMQNIDQYLVQDAENQTAYLKLPEGGWRWMWYGSDIEANAYYLKLLARTDPKGAKASGLVKYLLNNRKHATYWNSTRDTALCVEAMAEFLKASGEDNPEQTIEVWFDGDLKKQVNVDSKNLFTFDNQFLVTGDAVTTGQHKLELKRRGKGSLYWNAYLTNFTQEDFITSSGLEVKVQRNYYKLTEKTGTAVVAGARGQASDQKVLKYDRTKLTNLATITSQDLIEVELEIDSKNDYEYLIFEDMKAAGFEPVDLRSGYRGYEMGAYMELRDERVVFLVRRLARGKHSIRYRLRAEIPGQFSALPAKASGMYAPELRASSDEIKLIINEKPLRTIDH